MSAAAGGANAPPTAWQPFTFGGVAAFAASRFARFLVVELIVAVLFAASVVWFLNRAYCPVILQAVQKMPESARLANGQLQGVPDTLITQSRFLAIVVTTDPAADIGQVADLQIEFRAADFCTGSVYWPEWGWALLYPPGAPLNLARSSLEPAWGAWQPVLLISVAVAVVLLLLVVWALFATVYMIPARVIAWFADRWLDWRGAWRLCAAALLPGAFVMLATLFLYAGGLIDLVGLSFFAVIHLVLGWIYVTGAACKAPRLLPVAAKGNPFTA
jgi:hypothetical protein